MAGHNQAPTPGRLRQSSSSCLSGPARLLSGARAVAPHGRLMVVTDVAEGERSRLRSGLTQRV